MVPRFKLAALHFLVTLITVILTGALPNDAQGGGKLGLQVQATGNQFTGDLPDEGSWKGNGSLGAGLVAELNVSKTLSISFQPAYAPRHSRQEFKFLGSVIQYVDYELDYLSLPLIVRVTGDSDGVRGFVTGGLDVGILIDATVISESGSEDISQDLNQVTPGALFGAGVLVPVSRSFLNFELRYVQGLDDIVVRGGNSALEGVSGPSVKYRGMVLIVGFLFGLGSE